MRENGILLFFTYPFDKEVTKMKNNEQVTTPVNATTKIVIGVTPTKKDIALEEFIKRTSVNEELEFEVPDSETISEPAKVKKTKTETKKSKTKELPAKGTYVIEITPKGTTKKIWTGNGKDWVVKSKDSAQIYKTRAGAERWIEKFAKAQGTCKIVAV